MAKNAAPKREEKTPLQKYLAKKLPKFRRGDGDCVAFVAGWVNEVEGKEAVALERITQGEAVRRARSIVELSTKQFEALEWKESSEPKDGSVILVEATEALSGKTLAIYSEGKAVTRMEGPKLFVIDNPKVITSWSRS